MGRQAYRRDPRQRGQAGGVGGSLLSRLGGAVEMRRSAAGPRAGVSTEGREIIYFFFLRFFLFLRLLDSCGTS